MSAKRKRPARKTGNPAARLAKADARAQAAQLAAPNPKRKHPT